jgi:3D (Asp-Asp-Asp) domain-containing protein
MAMFNVAPVVAMLYLLCSGWVQAKAPATEAPGAPYVVTIYADGGVRRVCTTSGTVADVLAGQGIELGPLDRTSPAPDTPVAEGAEIHVTRVACREVVEEIPIRAKTTVLAEPNQPAGYTQVLQHGRDGRLRRTWRVWEKDGEVTLKGVVGEEVVEPAVNTLVLRGIRGTPSRGGDWRHPLRMEATAYYPGRRSCGAGATGYTATGVKAEKGVAAVDERVIPMGTRLYIPGYGFAVAADRGSAIKGMRIDLCFATYREAVEFGRRTVSVYVLD